MIKLTFSQIRDRGFNPALSKIMVADLPLVEARRIVEIVENIRKAQALSDERWLDVLKQHFKEETWNTAPELLDQADTKEAMADINHFMATEVKIDTPPIGGATLEKLQISPVELILLKGLIE